MSPWRYMEGEGVKKWPKKRFVVYRQPPMEPPLIIMEWAATGGPSPSAPPHMTLACLFMFIHVL